MIEIMDLIRSLFYITSIVLLVNGENCSWFRQKKGVGFEPFDCELQNFSSKTEINECLGSCKKNPQVRISCHFLSLFCKS